MASNEKAVGGRPMTKDQLTVTKKIKLGSLLSVLLAPFAKRFIAGTTLSSALDVVEKLQKQGFNTTLDHLGEDVTNRSEASKAAEQYVIMLKALNERKIEKNVSLKLSEMGLNIDQNFCSENLGKILKTAEDAHGFVRVDMEGSDVTSKTLDVVRNAKTSRIAPVGCVLQAMMKRTSDDLVDIIQREITVRLCKGAYKEPSEIAYTKMPDIRKNFITLMKRLLTSNLYHGIATHDEVLINETKNFVEKNNIDKKSFEFQMLLGIKSSTQRKLIQEGYNVRVYIPFGRSWLPYTLRRIREKKENFFMVFKSIYQR